MRLPEDLNLASVPLLAVEEGQSLKPIGDCFIVQNPLNQSRILFILANTNFKILATDGVVKIRKLGTFNKWYARKDEEFTGHSSDSADVLLDDKAYTLEDVQAQYDAWNQGVPK